MYSLNMPVSALRTKMRQEFERHRYVNQLAVVDVLIAQSHSEFQVRTSIASFFSVVIKRKIFREDFRGVLGKREYEIECCVDLLAGDDYYLL